MTSAATTARARWPYAGAGQRPLLLAAVLMSVGSFLPWVVMPLGNMLGIKGAGLWTLYLGSLGLGGALVRRRWAALASAVISGTGAVALTAWQLARLAQLSSATDSWGQLLPGMGLLIVLGSGCLALLAARRLQLGA